MRTNLAERLGYESEEETRERQERLLEELRYREAMRRVAKTCCVWLGGAAFVLIYLLFLVILGLPVMVMELAVGRASQKSIARSFHVLEPKGTKWHWYAWVGIAGNYLLMRGDLQSRDIVALMQRTFRFVAEFEGEVPGTAPQDCGNYLLHDLPMARWEARKYLEEVLEKMTEANLVYPSV